MASGDSTGACSQQLLPAATEILEQIFDGLPIADIGRLQQTSSHNFAVAEERRSRVLKRRRMEELWSLRKAHAIESALFFDVLASPISWTQGPNNQHRNVIEESTDDDGSGHWLQLSGGTDWQAFQGGFRCIAEDGMQPSWLTFRVRIATPELSCAFLTFAGAKYTWGLEDIVLAFHYSGDERSSHRRCFTVQTGAIQNGGTSSDIHVAPEIVADRPYQVSIHCDWAASVMTVFVDGVKHIDRMPFRTGSPIRYAALYNWRSGARTAFSELLLGDACPCATCDASVSALSSRIERARTMCCKRRALPTRGVRVPPVRSGTPSYTKKLVFATATLSVLAAALAQQLLVSSL